MEALRCLKRRLSDVVYKQLIRDLSGVAFLGSHGLAALIEATEHAQHRHATADRGRRQPAGNRPLQITGLHHMLALYHTVDQALAAGPNADP